MDWHSRFLQQAQWTADLRRYIINRIGVSPTWRILEVGCGTGAVLEIFPEITGEIIAETPRTSLFGLDINKNFLLQAQIYRPTAFLIQGDAVTLPFKSGCFDLIFCHFLLLWINNPLQALREMIRLVRPNGWFAAFAEPDYGGRIDFPTQLIPLGQMQANSLTRQGADPLLGRRIKALFHQSELIEIETGVLGANWRDTDSKLELENEWTVFRSDLENTLNQEELDRYESIDRNARMSGERVLFVPTFYGLGRVKS
jgi:ubiquinone/menaquinone biosynthesis C-methylase UbiE